MPKIRHRYCENPGCGIPIDDRFASAKFCKKCGLIRTAQANKRARIRRKERIKNERRLQDLQ